MQILRPMKRVSCDLKGSLDLAEALDLEAAAGGATVGGALEAVAGSPGERWSIREGGTRVPGVGAAPTWMVLSNDEAALT